MDSVTQAVLGAAVGEATLGRRVGTKAPLWGAMLGTLPDLDVLYPFADPVSAFTWHRGPSHSHLRPRRPHARGRMADLKLHPGTSEQRRGWYRLVLMVFGTHILLDCFTVYGTQALWPLPVPPVGWATIFIIDPLYTLPLAAGVLAALLLRRSPVRAWRWNLAGLALSSLYLAWSAGAKLYADHRVRDILAREGVPLRAPADPAHTLQHLALAGRGREGDGYFEGLWSLVSPEKGLTLTHHDHRPDLLVDIDGVARGAAPAVVHQGALPGRAGRRGCRHRAICAWAWTRTTCSPSAWPRPATHIPDPSFPSASAPSGTSGGCERSGNGSRRADGRNRP